MAAGQITPSEVCPFLFFVTVVRVRKLFAAPGGHPDGCGLEKAASHVWLPEVNSALQRYMVLLYQTCCWKSKFCIMLVFL